MTAASSASLHRFRFPAAAARHRAARPAAAPLPPPPALSAVDRIVQSFESNPWLAQFHDGDDARMPADVCSAAAAAHAAVGDRAELRFGPLHPCDQGAHTAVLRKAHVRRGGPRAPVLTAAIPVTHRAEHLKFAGPRCLL